MNHRVVLLFIMVVGLSVLALGETSWAGGTLTGKVLYQGTVPDPKTFELKKFPNTDFCRHHPSTSPDGKLRILQEVKVTDDGALQEAIVAVRDIEDKSWIKAFDRTTHVGRLCAWEPFTGIVVNQKDFQVENLDADPDDPKSKEGVLHNPHGFDVLGARSMTLFNVGLAKKGDTTTKTLKMRMARKGSVMRLQCDQHEFMQAWFLPVENPYYTKVGPDGTFTIKDIPAGKHTIMAWHPVAGQVEHTIEIPEGQTVKATLIIQ